MNLKSNFAKIAVITLLFSLFSFQANAQTTTTVKVSYGYANEAGNGDLDFTFPALAGAKNITAEAWGGGGGGGGAKASWSGTAAGGGGGGGGYAAVNFGAINSALAVRVGYGGAYGNGNAGGSNGSFSKVAVSSSNYIQANGGNPGSGAEKNVAGLSAGNGGSGGGYETAGNYDFTLAKGNDGAKQGDLGSLTGTGGAGGNAANDGGSGGSAVGNGDGNPGGFPGGGGAGGGRYQAGASSTSRHGGKGGNGKVQITFSYLTPATPIVSTSIANSLTFENATTLTIENYDERFSYQWYKDNTPIEGATGESYTVTTPGAYEVHTWGEVSASSFAFANAAAVEITANGDGSYISGTTLNIGAANEEKQSRTIKFVYKYDKSNIADFGTCYADSTSEVKKSVSLVLSYLSGNVTLSLKNGETSAFSLDKNSLNFDGSTNAIDIEISFTPKAIGAIADELIISSPNAPAVRIPLSGTGILSTPTALPATYVKSSGFNANWQADPYAESYLLTVLDNTGTPVEGYDRFDVGNVTYRPIGNLMPESSYSYTVIIYSHNTESAPSNSIEVTTLAGAVISYNQPADFVQVAGTSASKTLRVSGTRLTEGIALNLQSTVFSLDKTELDVAGGSVKLTFAPTAVGVFEETITLSSYLAEDVLVKIKGTALPATVTALPATEIGTASFTANWDAAPNAADYLLTVKEGSAIVLDNQSTGSATSYSVSATAGKNYTYSVKVVEAGLNSAASNEIAVITPSAPQPTAYPAKTSIRVKWAAVPAADEYKVTLYQNGTPVSGSQNVAVSATEYTFGNLSMNTDYTYEVIAVFGANEYSSGILSTKTATEFFGQQIPNLGFELWEGGGDDAEPVSWNSFRNAGGSIADGMLGSTVKKKKIEVTSDIRPGSAGSKSVRIWTTVVVGVKANGNMTTGQIMANSTTATSSDNYNQTQTGNSAFNMPFTSRPDSITVWAKFVPSNTGDQASLTATIHGNTNYKDPADNGSAYEVAKAMQNISATASKGWQRLSIPFVAKVSNDPRYILISATTNKTPGAGNDNDALFLDDILFVYKPTLAVGALDKAKYLVGETISVPYTLTGTMSANNLNAAANVVYLELSDENGSFSAPSILAQATTDFSGEFSVALPTDLPLSANYKVRVRSTNYPMTSDASAAFELRSMPAVPVALEASEVSAAAFTANWEEVSDATGYVLDINGEEIALEAGITSYQKKNLQPETDYIYKVKALKNDMSSDFSNSISVTTSSGGTIFYNGNTALTAIEHAPQSTTLAISGTDLLENISIALVSNPSGFFAIDLNSVGTEGGELLITYTPTEYGTHAARVQLKSLFADNVYIELTGENKADIETSIPNVTENIVKLYPNPTSDILNVKETANGQVYRITNTQGKVVLQGILSNSVISVSSLNTGLYWLQIGQSGAAFIKR